MEWMLAGWRVGRTLHLMAGKGVKLPSLLPLPLAQTHLEKVAVRMKTRRRLRPDAERIGCANEAPPSSLTAGRKEADARERARVRPSTGGERLEGGGGKEDQMPQRSKRQTPKEKAARDATAHWR